MEPKNELKLPTSLVGRVDVARMLRELGGLNDFFVAAKARQAGTPIQPPGVTRVLSALAETNHINLLEEGSRRELAARLEVLRKQAPQLHISFAVEPSPKALEQLVTWFRSSIHPHTLLQVGLQPGIALGCTLRTPNKFFDMSLRAYLEKQEQYLVELIKGAVNGR